MALQIRTWIRSTNAKSWCPNSSRTLSYVWLRAGDYFKGLNACLLSQELDAATQSDSESFGRKQVSFPIYFIRSRLSCAISWKQVSIKHKLREPVHLAWQIRWNIQSAVRFADRQLACLMRNASVAVNVEQFREIFVSATKSGSENTLGANHWNSKCSAAFYQQHAPAQRTSTLSEPNENGTQKTKRGFIFNWIFLKVSKNCKIFFLLCNGPIRNQHFFFKLSQFSYIDNKTRSYKIFDLKLKIFNLCMRKIDYFFNDFIIFSMRSHWSLVTADRKLNSPALDANQIFLKSKHVEPSQ